MKEIAAIVADLTAPANLPGVLATLVSVEGSSYRRPGARLLLKADGSRTGSVSGGCLEEDVLARAAKILRSGQPETVVYDTTAENDLVWGVGLGCHGVVRVLLERIATPPSWAQALAKNLTLRRPTELSVLFSQEDVTTMGTRLAAPGDCGDPERLFADRIEPPTALVIFGAGDDAQPLARLAKELGWTVTVADPRAAYANPQRFPGVDRVIAGPVERLVTDIAMDRATAVAVMTHHYMHDLPLLKVLITRNLAYLGLLGPRKRADKILADLAADGAGVAPEHRARLRAPIGLDLGADGPEQVALSIVAEIQAELAGRDARPLRLRERPIHG